jgi:hypothetical protein
MNSRDRIKNALDHRPTKKLPVDFGGSLTTGISVNMVYKLRQYYGLDDPGTPVKLLEPFLFLGDIKEDLRDIIGSDVLMVHNLKSIYFGFDYKNWKEWMLDDGTPVLVPSLFNTEKNEDGSIYQYPEGNKSAEPSAVLLKNSYHFEQISRQKSNYEIRNLNPKDNVEEFRIYNEEELHYIKDSFYKLNKNLDYAVIFNSLISSFGDLGILPGMNLRDPKGIRDISKWYMTMVEDSNYIKKVFSLQLEIALINYKNLYEKLGNKIDIVYTMLTDFGDQSGLTISKEMYRALFKPFSREVNKWIHKNTGWKTMGHSCGSIYELMPDLIDAGFDIINPVQISAYNMEPSKLKKEFGKDLVLWGGGIDTQKVLSFLSPKQIKEHIRKNIEIFFEGGGYVFAGVNNISAGIPLENVIALIEAINEYR